MKVSVKNYNIIKQAALEFIPGLNVVTGPSNNGKSSIFKAIKALTYTVPGTNSIRSGQTSYSVGIILNGHTVILQKGLKESIYAVDGEKYTKFGQTTPEAVSNALNMKELTLNGVKEQLNFWDQMEYPFLLDKTPVELFRFIIDSGDNDQISKALKDMVSDRQNLSRSIDQLQGSINVVDQEIEQYETQLNNSKDIIDSCNGIINLQSKISKLERLKYLKQKLDNIIAVKQPLIENEIKTKQTLTIHNQFSKSINDNINKLVKLNNLFIKLHNIIGDQSDLQESRSKLNKLVMLKEIDSSKLNLMKKFKNTINYITEQRKLLDVKPHAHWNDKIDADVTKLYKLINCYKKHEDIDYRQVDLSTTIIAYKTAYKNLTDVKDCFDICPYCGQKIHI